MKLFTLMRPKKKSLLLLVPDTKFDEDGYFVNDRVSARNRLNYGRS